MNKLRKKMLLKVYYVKTAGRSAGTAAGKVPVQQFHICCRNNSYIYLLLNEKFITANNNLTALTLISKILLQLKKKVLNNKNGLIARMFVVFTTS